MKIETEIPIVVRKRIMTEHERVMARIAKMKKNSAIVPIRTCRMNILQPDGSEKLQKTIVPATIISTSELMAYDGKLPIGSLTYKIANNGQSFPLGHIFNSSGALCLGTIFVPSMIDEHSLQQPLETLFLYNDRNLEHGSPVLTITANKLDKIREYFKDNLGEMLPSWVPRTGNIGQEWLRNDTLWAIGAYVYEKYELHDAYKHMGELFNIIFPPK